MNSCKPTSPAASYCSKKGGFRSICGDSFSSPEAQRTAERRHLEWSLKQSRILTANGDASIYYSKERGFPFSSEELPHHHLERGDSNRIFRRWAHGARYAVAGDEQRPNGLWRGHHGQKDETTEATSLRPFNIPNPIVGAWRRPLFVSKWEHSTDRDETVYNVQTGTLFVDLRVPKSKPATRWERHSSRTIAMTDGKGDDSRAALEYMSDLDLRSFARQHVFAGFSVVARETTVTGAARDGRRQSYLPICTRHHCVDWNYIPGKPRSRPNKWYIEGRPRMRIAEESNTEDPPFDVWKELSYATDDVGQCYYWERWERIHGDNSGRGVVLAMRKRVPQGSINCKGCEIGAHDDHRDGILVVVGDHFNYVVGRQFTGNEKHYPDATNLIEVVDCALSAGERATAVSYLTMDGGHGTVSSGWKIDCAIHPWKHGKRLYDCIGFGDGGNSATCPRVEAGDNDDFFTWTVWLGGKAWDVYECTLRSSRELEEFIAGDVDPCSSRETKSRL